jgi:hypothetical protein
MMPSEHTPRFESGKRFHKKGFHGHTGQTPRDRKLDIPRWLMQMPQEWVRPQPQIKGPNGDFVYCPPDLPNHDRMLIRKERRSMMRPKDARPA